MVLFGGIDDMNTSANRQVQPAKSISMAKCPTLVASFGHSKLPAASAFLRYRLLF